VSREASKALEVVLITHGHSDHANGLCDCIGNTHPVTLFVPSICARDVFVQIKSNISMRKGRAYSDHEICQIVRVYGCVRRSRQRLDESVPCLVVDQVPDLVPDRVINQVPDPLILVHRGIDPIMSTESPDLAIVRMVECGTRTRIKLANRDEVEIEPFECYHTIDTCGYMVYEVKPRLSDLIQIDVGAQVDVRFTEDQHSQDIGHTRPEAKQPHDDIDDIDYIADPRFADMVDFCASHGVRIVPCITRSLVSARHILYTRRLTFPDGMRLPTKDQSGQCILQAKDFVFLKKYKIPINQNHLVPMSMFFGDTCAYVFEHSHVHRLLGIANQVIIECTFLEAREQIAPDKYKKLQAKKHMFLPELYPVFEAYPSTRFILIHFSARYTRDTIRWHVDKVRAKYPNVSAFI
jgi:ribonuclease BN (tRNA processing enzyme)